MKAEEKARELYPDKEYPDVFGLNVEQLHERSIEHQNILMQREAFLKGYEYANQQPEVETYTSDLIESLDDDSISTLKSMVRVGIKMEDIENWKDGEYYGDAQKYVDIALSQIDRWIKKQPEGERECKYCGAMTTEPDEYCYRNPNSSEKQPEQESIKPKQIR